MKGNVGTTESIYHTRLPHQRKLERMAKCLDLSREAKVRLTWIGHYKKQGKYPMGQQKTRPDPFRRRTC